MAKESMWRWACKLYYGKQLYSGHYWDNKVTLKTALKRMEKLQQEGMNAVFRFELADYDTNVVVAVKQPTIPKREEKPVWPFPANPLPPSQPPEPRHE
jgi:hypothetical protein